MRLTSLIEVMREADPYLEYPSEYGQRCWERGLVRPAVGTAGTREPQLFDADVEVPFLSMWRELMYLATGNNGWGASNFGGAVKRTQRIVDLGAKMRADAPLLGPVVYVVSKGGEFWWTQGERELAATLLGNYGAMFAVPVIGAAQATDRGE
jgi:hypothetical protein